MTNDLDVNEQLYVWTQLLAAVVSGDLADGAIHMDKKSVSEWTARMVILTDALLSAHIAKRNSLSKARR